MCVGYKYRLSQSRLANCNVMQYLSRNSQYIQCGSKTQNKILKSPSTPTNNRIFNI